MQKAEAEDGWQIDAVSRKRAVWKLEQGGVELTE
jgi:hypothetical protein